MKYILLFILFICSSNIIKAQDLKPTIEFIDMALDIRDKYQYFTEANMNKLLTAVYDAPFASLEEGVDDYAKNYLLPSKGYYILHSLDSSK
jgi:ADP-L-glycero-D-manno-heptose 6-epimerase